MTGLVGGFGALLYKAEAHLRADLWAPGTGAETLAELLCQEYSKRKSAVVGRMDWVTSKLLPNLGRNKKCCG